MMKTNVKKTNVNRKYVCRCSTPLLFLMLVIDGGISSADVLRTLVYHQITTNTEAITNFYAGSGPVLSDNGNKAAFSINRTDPVTSVITAHVYVINSDGSGQTEVATTEPNPWLDISADGSKVMTMVLTKSGGPKQIRINGALIVEDKGVILSDPVLSGDGSKVFFILDRTTELTGFGEALGGIYVINTNGTGLRRIVGRNQIGPVIGAAPDDLIFFGYGNYSMDVSSDGGRIVFGVNNYYKDEPYLCGVNLSGGGLHKIIGAPDIIGIGRGSISGDGSKVLCLASMAPCCSTPSDLIVFNFDGSGKRVLTSFGGSADSNIMLNGDGSQALLRDTGQLYRTDGSGVVQLSINCNEITGSNMPSVTMDATATRFLYFTRDYPGCLATLDINPPSRGAAPSITAPVIYPSYVLTNQRSEATLRAAISSATPLTSVCPAVLKDGLIATGTGIGGYGTMYDNGNYGDATPGDGIYTNNSLYSYSGVLGRHTARITAGTQTPDGKRHVLAIDYDGFDVVESVPPPPSVSITSIVTPEGAASSTHPVYVKVSLSATSAQPVTVNYATSNLSATAPNDYTTKSGTLTFSPGQTTKSVAVTVKGDNVDEANEKFRVTLSSPTNATLGSALAAVTILDDDGPLPSLRISDVSVTEGGSGTTRKATLQVTLSVPDGRQVTVNYATENGTATAPGDYAAKSGTLTFLPGQSGKNVTVTVKGDAVFESNEAFRLKLSGAVNATITDGTGVVTILNDDPSAAQPVAAISGKYSPTG